MNSSSTNIEEDLQINDKRHARGRFSWVKRLVQGPNKNLATGIRTPPYEHPIDLDIRVHGPQTDDNSTRKSIKSHDFASDEESASVNSDNFSTTPLKSIASHTSTTNPPSVLSGENTHNDNASLVASTAETSLSPSTHVSLSPSVRGQYRERDSSGNRDRDSESIITLASSSRRVRRRSIDTNCSMAGIAPASIMERLSVPPNAHNVDSPELE